MLYGWIAAAIFFIPSYVVAWVEGWTYVDSMYFAFQTLTTVGKGIQLKNDAKTQGFIF